MASSPARRTFGLGRGLDALIPSAGEDRGVLELDLDRIERNPDQPRTSFDEDSLGELAASFAFRVRVRWKDGMLGFEIRKGSERVFIGLDRLG